MPHQFVYTHPKQRELWQSFVDTIERATKKLGIELAQEAPDVDALDKLCGTIQHDLNAIRYAYMAQLAARPFAPIKS